jgi:hypothetical protein
VRWFINQVCGSLSAFRSRSDVTSAAIAGQANMLPARNAAWNGTLRLAMNASHALRNRFASITLRESLHDPKGGVRGEYQAPFRRQNGLICNCGPGTSNLFLDVDPNGQTLPSWSTPQVVGYLGYSGGVVIKVAKAALTQAVKTRCSFLPSPSSVGHGSYRG